MATRSATRSSRIMSTQIGARDVLGVAARQERLRVEVRLALKLDDPRRHDLVGVTLLLGGVLEELGRHRTRVDPSGHEVVALVAEDTDQLGGQGLVQDGDTRSRSAP